MRDFVSKLYNFVKVRDSYNKTVTVRTYNVTLRRVRANIVVVEKQ
jgi:hypothetical protein